MEQRQQFYSYLAGFIDADGCFQLIKHKNRHVKRGFSWAATLTITQASKSFLELLKENIGFGILATGKRLFPNHVLVFTSGYLRRLLPKILPYLKKKKAQAELLWEAVSLMRNRGPGHHYDADERLEQLHKEIKLLKPRNRFTGRSKFWLARRRKLEKFDELVAKNLI